jgi:glycosyltransferase involved in cell wall biosynthesis
MPEISIVTPSWNRAQLLKRLWKSLASQNIDFQWVIVDDGSKDDTEHIIESFKDKRITFEKLSKNMGVNFARNAGVALAKSKYVVFLDSDDELVPNTLLSAVEKIKSTSSEVGVVCFACVMAETGEQTSKLIDGAIFGEKEIVCEHALRGGDNAYIYKKEIFDHFLLPNDLKGCEHVFVYSISKKWKFLVVDAPLTLVHRQLDNLSDASSLVARSKDIAVSYEMILAGHRDILNSVPSAKASMYRKGIYRYGVAGKKLEVLRLAKAGLKNSPIKEKIKTCGLAAVALLPLTAFEFWRISRVNKRLEGRRT